MTPGLDRVIHLTVSAAHHAVITGTFYSHADEVRTAVAEAFRCAEANGLIEVVPPDRWPEYVALHPPYAQPTATVAGGA
jgi:hypothetical protein